MSIGRLAPWIAAAWGVASVVFVVAFPIWRLTPRALGAVASGLAAAEWAALIAWVALIAYTEGYRGFQKRFAPRVAARTLQLTTERRLLPGLLAPLYLMSLTHDTPRRLLGAWLLTTSIVAFILLVRLLPHPWRGIIDAGVAVGLTWGLLALLHAWTTTIRRSR